MELLVGSYTSGTNRGAGISSLAIDAAGLLSRPRLLAEVPDPSFLIAADDGVYAVLEQEQGQVLAFERDAHNGSLDLTSQSPVIGADPCHLALLPDGRVVAANYSSGSVVLLGARGSEVLELQDTLQLSGSGPVTERQEGPHAHQCVPTPYGTVLVPDLGSDTVLELHPGAGELREAARLPLPAGAGPRHLALRRSEAIDELLVNGELDGQLHVFSRSRREAPGGWEYQGHLPLYTRKNVGNSYPAHIELSRDGSLAYASIRGQDQISVFQLGAADSGALPELLQEVSTGGAWPRHFTLGQNALYAANQKGDSITVFARRADGLLGEQLQEISIGTPVCLVLT